MQDKDIADNIGERIRERRRSMKLSQEEVGECLGVGKAAIWKYENGVVENIPIGNLIALCSILRLTPNELLGWEEIKKLEVQMGRNVRKKKQQIPPKFSIYQRNEWDGFTKDHSLCTLTGFLYIVQIGDMVKIGKSIFPYGRISNLKQTFENYGDKEVGLCAISEEHQNYTANEKILHKYFEKERIPKTELFKVDFDRAIREIENGWTGITVS